VAGSNDGDDMYVHIKFYALFIASYVVVINHHVCV